MKILVIGCGSIGERHIRNLISIKAGQIFAFDIDKKKLKKIKRDFPSVVISDRLDALWDRGPEAVFVCVPTALHIKYSYEAAKRGCHIFIEKPLSNNIQGLDELMAMARHKHLVAYVGYSYRFNRCLTTIKRLLEKNAVGKIIAGRFHFGSYLPDRHPREDYRRGYGARSSLGGGVILDALSHLLDSSIFLFGMPGELCSYHSKSSSLDIDVEDRVEALLRFSKGELLSLHANFFERPHRNTLELVGEKGVILCDFVKSILKAYDARKKRWKIFYGDNDINTVYLRELKHFLRCIKSSSAPLVDVETARREIYILRKIKQASIEKWERI